MMDKPTKRPVIAIPSDQDHTGRTLGAEEIELVSQSISSGTLTSTKGSFTKRLEHEFAGMLGCEHAFACNSGTAALHVAIAAIDPSPGDEIVTTSITDMGALTPILYQTAIPVFADVDPVTCCVTAETIERCLSERTKAIIVTHLFGNPCDMGPIMRLANARGIPVIEDCAQAFLATYNGRYVGTEGAIGCFSLQQGKHITTGEGGLVTTNDKQFARRMFLFINKAWGYGDENPDHYFIALNYRISELQSAVAVAQLKKLKAIVGRRVTAANQLTAMISDIAGIGLPVTPAGGRHVYWKYCLRIDDGAIPGGVPALAAYLRERGISSAPRYIQKPAFRCKIFAEQVTFGQSRFPFTLARPEALNYGAERFPGTFKGLRDILVLPWNEAYETRHVEYIAECICDGMKSLQ
jgi:perosamine synthetase